VNFSRGFAQKILDPFDISYRFVFKMDDPAFGRVPRAAARTVLAGYP